jgi:hypothetical protein
VENGCIRKALVSAASSCLSIAVRELSTPGTVSSTFFEFTVLPPV